MDDALEADPERRPTPEALRAVLQAAESRLAESGGLVEPAVQRRFGLTSIERGPRRLWRLPLGGPLATRLGAAAGAGLLVPAVIAQLGPAPSFSPLLAAAAAAVLCLLLPRLGWLATVASCCERCGRCRWPRR